MKPIDMTDEQYMKHLHKVRRAVAACGHDWEPVQGWRARYRCRWCGAIAYRKSVLGDQLDSKGPADRIMDEPLTTSVQLVTYLCQHPGCLLPAQNYVRKAKKGTQLCAYHRALACRPLAGMVEVVSGVASAPTADLRTLVLGD